MTRDTVKKKIKVKFGTYSRFVLIAELDRYEFQRDFLEANRVDKKEIERISKLCDELEVDEDPRMIHPSQVKDFRAAIDKFGGVKTFVDKYGKQFEFSEMSVRQIMAGDRLMITKKIRSMFNLIGIK